MGGLWGRELLLVLSLAPANPLGSKYGISHNVLHFLFQAETPTHPPLSSLERIHRVLKWWGLRAHDVCFLAGLLSFSPHSSLSDPDIQHVRPADIFTHLHPEKPVALWVPHGIYKCSYHCFI